MPNFLRVFNKRRRAADQDETHGDRQGHVMDSEDTAMTSGTSTTGDDQQRAIVVKGLTGRPPVALYLSCDNYSFSAYQILVRKNVELFEAEDVDVQSNAQGRNKPIVLGQVGIRCKHCNMVHPCERQRGATYYPSKLAGLYQAAQNLANGHLVEHCKHVPTKLRTQLITLRAQKSSAGAGKNMWADRTAALGVFEDASGLRFAPRLNAFARNLPLCDS